MNNDILSTSMALVCCIMVAGSLSVLCRGPQYGKLGFLFCFFKCTIHDTIRYSQIYGPSFSSCEGIRPLGCLFCLYGVSFAFRLTTIVGHDSISGGVSRG